MAKILVIGAAGQLGIELVLALQAQHGVGNVDVSDIRVPDDEGVMRSRFLHLDATDEGAVHKVLEEGRYHAVYHLAAMLSATGEKKPIAAWDLNMQSLLNVLEAAKEGWVERVFWPSSIAVFGPQTPSKTSRRTRCSTRQRFMDRRQAGEYWCRYYHEKFGVDVRSIATPV